MIMYVAHCSGSLFCNSSAGEWGWVPHKHNTHWANFFSSSPSPWTLTDSRRCLSAVAQLFRQSIIKRKYCLTCFFTLLSQLNWVLNNTRKNKVIPAKFLEVTYSIMALWYYCGQLSHLGQPFQFRENFASDSSLRVGDVMCFAHQVKCYN